MKKLFVFALMALMLVSIVAAQSDATCGDKWFCNQELTLDCQKFYDDSNYYTIAKWSFNGEEYSLLEQNIRYRYYDTTVEGTSSSAEWSSNPEVVSVLVNAGDLTFESAGGETGVVAEENINTITFCGYSTSSSRTSVTSSSNGVPEFPALSVVAAVLVVTLGLVFIRKN